MPIEPIPDAEPTEAEAQDSNEIRGNLDLSIVGDQEVKPGDRITLEVVEVDPDMGSLTVRYPKPETKEGIEEMAEAFDRPGYQKPEDREPMD